MSFSRRAWCLAAMLTLAAGAASASEIKKIGVMSVLGSELHVISRAPVTGTRLDRNPKETVKVPPGNFENFILQKMADGARAQGWGEALILARPANGSMPWQPDGQAVLVTRPLLEAAQAAKLSHLVLIQPARGEAKAQMTKTVMGNGQLEGLGFYVDTMMDVDIEETNRRSSGFIAPFAYFDMYLVDVATLDLQAEHRARVSVALADPELAGGDPWASLSTQSKVVAIRRMLEAEIGKALREWTSPSAEGTKR